ncbi:MAG: 4-oxalocrotonate tautomerase family protein [Alphaproteobacteria bacterium]|nr:4-oxalocrotonate tautomerase family protein [Alphaproteobacteria bacterium]
MPYVNVQITAGVTRQQKSEMVRQITDTLVTVLNKSPEHIHIVLQEIEEQDWGYAGMLTDEWKAQRSG